jgi:anthranilate synthase component 2
MIVLIDNYDSFSYNLYQLVGSFEPDLKVIRNDTCTVEELRAMGCDGIILSPGPGKPRDAGICEAVVKELGGEIPIMGVCLGHQAICEAFGGEVSYAGQMVHGKASTCTVVGENRLFAGMPEQFQVARYHSLSAREATLPEELRVTARSEDGEVMAVEHKEKPIFGLQFHPESVLTPMGDQIMKNFMEVIKTTK